VWRIETNNHLGLYGGERVSVVVRSDGDRKMRGHPTGNPRVARGVELPCGHLHQPEPVEKQRRECQPERRGAGIAMDVLLSDSACEGGRRLPSRRPLRPSRLAHIEKGRNFRPELVTEDSAGLIVPPPGVHARLAGEALVDREARGFDCVLPAELAVLRGVVEVRL
jgi:hypothetical protein